MSPDNKEDLEALMKDAEEQAEQMAEEAIKAPAPWDPPEPLRYTESTFGGGPTSKKQRKARAKAKAARKSRKKNRKR